MDNLDAILHDLDSIPPQGDTDNLEENDFDIEYLEDEINSPSVLPEIADDTHTAVMREGFDENIPQYPESDEDCLSLASDEQEVDAYSSRANRVSRRPQRFGANIFDY